MFTGAAHPKSFLEMRPVQRKVMPNQLMKRMSPSVCTRLPWKRLVILTTSQGHSHGHSPQKLRNLYLTKSKKYDSAIFKSREGHIESILLFVRTSRVSSATPRNLTVPPFFPPLCQQTGLFSATVSLFVIESYKLAPDPGEQTVALLNQVSQQLMGISRGAHLGLPPSPDTIPFRPSPPVVRASILWFLSLGLNITCAIWAILWQQWWQQYIDLLGQSGELHRRAPRTYLFSGFGMERTVETIWMLLHTSVLFFLIGLIDFLLLINKTVALAFLGYIVPLALVYIAATLLQCFFSDSHSFSSSGSWKVSQLDNRRPRSLPPFRRPPYIGENSWRDDREHPRASGSSSGGGA